MSDEWESDGIVEVRVIAEVPKGFSPDKIRAALEYVIEHELPCGEWACPLNKREPRPFYLTAKVVCGTLSGYYDISDHEPPLSPADLLKRADDDPEALFKDLDI